jgi:hypothetical protein
MLYSQRLGRRGCPSTPDLVDRPPMKATVNVAIGAVSVLLGIAAVYVAMPNRRGESPGLYAMTLSGLFIRPCACPYSLWASL